MPSTVLAGLAYARTRLDGYHEPGRRGGYGQRSSEARISSGRNLNLHHETNNTASGRLLCLPSRLRRQPTPAQLQRADWLGSSGPMLQHSRLEPGSGKISELHPRPKTPAPPVFTTAVMSALVPSL